MNSKHIIVAGMPRSATTFLYFVAKDHPEIFLPYLKESNFFVTNQTRGVDWYRELFDDAAPGQTTLDISPATFIDPEADERILETCPDAKIIVMVRDPIEWCLSFYSQFKSFDYSTPVFERFAKGHLYRHGVGQVQLKFDDNFVPERIQLMMERFGDRLLVMSYRLMRDDPVRALQVIEDFSDLTPHFSDENVTNLKINASGRRNLRLVSYLLSREWLVRSINLLGISRLARKLRSFFDRTSAQIIQPRDVLYTAEELEINEMMFRDQQNWVDNFFEENLVLRGTGEPFHSARFATVPAK
ncbi:sulfotransferase [Parvibaculum lavamentivorans]|nr:sulfotransferase [Parvibaculum lavamentivorans]